MVSLCCTNQEILRFFVRGLIWTPLLVFAGAGLVSNLADFMVELWLDSFSWLSEAVVLGWLLILPQFYLVFVTT